MTEEDGSCAQDDACGVCGGDDSSCSGCTNPAADNYDASALIDDGSCSIRDVQIPMQITTIQMRQRTMSLRFLDVLTLELITTMRQTPLRMAAVSSLDVQILQLTTI